MEIYEPMFGGLGYKSGYAGVLALGDWKGISLVGDAKEEVPPTETLGF